MAKKNEPTKVIIRKMTESEIKGIGSNLYVKRKGKYWLGILVLCVVWLFVTMMFFDMEQIRNQVISFLPIVVSFVGWVWQYIKAGNKFWEQVKDKPDPVEIK